MQMEKIIKCIIPSDLFVLYLSIFKLVNLLSN